MRDLCTVAAVAVVVVVVVHFPVEEGPPRRAAVILGIVADGGDQPLSDVRVWASLREHLPHDASDGSRFAQTRTDAAGEFTLQGLATGTFEVTAQAPGFHGPRQRAESGGSPIRLVLRRTVGVAGLVLGDGGPVAAAAVRGEVETGSSVEVVGRAVTGDDGRFVVRNLPRDCEVRLRIEHDHFAPFATAVRPDGKTPMTFVLSPGVRVAGTVVDSQGDPVEGATVRVTSGGRTVATVSSDTRGRWMAGGLAGGNYSVGLSGDGLLATEPVPVAPGATGVRLVARPGETITGAVREADGAAPSRALRVAAVDAAGREIASVAVGRDGSGRFELRGLPPGSYTLRVRSTAGRVARWAERPGVVAGAIDVEIRLERTPLRRN